MLKRDLLDLETACDLIDRGRFFELPNYEALTSEAAELLADVSGDLDLSGLRELDAASARCLSRRVLHGEVGLNLDGLSALTPEVGQILAQSSGELSLRGLDELSAPLARTLATHRGVLWLPSDLSLTMEAASSLRRHEGVLMIGLAQGADPALEELAFHGGELWFYEAMWSPSQLPDAPASVRDRFMSARLTSAHLNQRWVTQGGNLVAPDTKSWNPWYWVDEEEWLDEPYCLGGFKAVDVAAAALIARNPHWNHDGHALHLSALQSLSFVQAVALAQTAGMIKLGHPEVSRETRAFIDSSDHLCFGD